MVKTLIIGYGNPLRGDDGVGWVAAEQAANLWPSDAVDVFTTHQLTPDLAANISAFDQLILIDASKVPTAERVRIAPIRPEGHSPMTSSHQLLPGELLACAGQLYGAVPRAWLITVRGEAFEFSDRLSPPVLAVMPEVLEHIRAQVEMDSP